MAGGDSPGPSGDGGAADAGAGAGAGGSGGAGGAPRRGLSGGPPPGGPALQGLLRRLGAGLDDILPGVSATHGRLRNLLAGLKDEEEQGVQLESLIELCELLSMATEDSLATFSVDSFVPALKSLLDDGQGPDTMLYAARALTQMMDVLPESCGAVVHYGCVELFCARLLNIEFIDLAEQSLLALEKASVDFPRECLGAGTLSAVLQFLDFFPTSVQRVAMNTAANVCRSGGPPGQPGGRLARHGLGPAAAAMLGLSPPGGAAREGDESGPGADRRARAEADFGAQLTENVPLLCNVLNNADSRVVESACLAFGRLAESCKGKAALLETLCASGYLHKAMAFLSAGRGDNETHALSPGAYTTVVRSLTACAEGSVQLTADMLGLGLADTLAEVLAQDVGGGGSPAASSASLTPGSPGRSPMGASPASRNADQMYELLSLVCALLPPLPPPRGAADASRGDEAGPGPESTSREAEQLLKERPELLVQYGAALFPVLVAVYGGTVSTSVRTKCATSVAKVLHFSDGETLLGLFRNLKLSSFVASLLSARDTPTASLALQMAEILMDKLPDTFREPFAREGVFHAVAALEGRLSASAAADGKGSPTDKDEKRKSPAAAVDAGTALPPRTPRTPRTPGAGAGGSDVAALRSAVHARARNFTASFAPKMRLKGFGGELRTKCEKLAGAVAKKGGAEGAALGAVLSDVARGEYSTFEVIESGLVGSLLDYLATPHEAGDAAEGLRRARLWVEKAYADDGVISAVVGAVEDALSQTELLPVVLFDVQSAGHSSSGGPGTGGAARGGSGDGARIGGLQGLATPFKLRLQRKPGESAVRDYSAAVNYVAVEPLSPIAAIEEFLWMRVRRPPGDAASPSRGAAGPSSKGKDEKDSGAEAGPSRTRAGERAAAKAGDDEDDEDDVDDEDVEDEDEDEDMDHDDDHMCIDEEDELDLDGEGDEVDAHEDEDVSRPESAGLRRGADGVAEVDLEQLSRTGSKRAPAEKDGASSAAAAGPSTAAAGPSPGASSSNLASREGRLTLYLNGVRLSPTQTILQAICGASGVSGGEEMDADADGSGPGRGLWNEVYTLEYEAAESSPALPSRGAAGGTNENTSPQDARPISDFLEGLNTEDLRHAMVRAIPELVDVKGISEDAGRMLALLRCLWFINGLVGEGVFGSGYAPVSAEPFCNAKLAPKLLRMLGDPLTLCSGSLPRWCHVLVKECSFLFPFEARRQYFYLTSFGLGRALQRLQSQQRESGEGDGGRRSSTDFGEQGPRVARIQREKVRVSRERVLESAVKVMELYGAHRAVLEVEYFGEVGIGLGPTLEFYTLVSHALQKSKLGLWREEARASGPSKPEAGGGSTKGSKNAGVREVRKGVAAPAASAEGQWVHAPQGLFPVPLRSGQALDAEKSDLYRFVGRLMGKALQDGRMLDMHFAPALFELALLGGKPDLHLLAEVDPGLGKSMIKLQRLWEAARATGGSVVVDGCPVEDLCLDFTLPGSPDIELCPGGRDVAVTSDNVGEYVSGVLNLTLGSGVRQQLAEVRAGVDEVFDLAKMGVFEARELGLLLCGGAAAANTWTVEYLSEAVHFDHGYTKKGDVPRWLMEVLVELSAEEVSKFLTFVTGSPRLMPGGLSALVPRLTVVRKVSDECGDADDNLPSVMTCTNYLKLPPYSSKATLRDRLMYAVAEGQGSFHLS